MAARGYAGAVAKVYGAQEHTLTVTKIEDATPHFRRITFHAPELLGSQPVEPAEWIRLWAPDATRPGREHMRGYTMVNPDLERGEVGLEFVLHDPSGPASTWARSAKVGDIVAATRWASTHFALPDPAPAGYLLIGDSAALPAINAILATIPDTNPVEVLLEQHHDLDRQLPLTAHPRATVTWVPDTAGALAAAIDDRDWSDWYAWVTCETQATKQARARLKELGFPNADVHGRAYWTRGKAMGTGRDTTEANAAAVPAPRTAPDEPPVPVAAASGARGQWRSRAGSRLLQPLKGRFVLAGLFQAIVSLVQLAPFVVLVEICRRLLADPAAAKDLANLGVLALILMGTGAALAGILVVAMHALDARFGYEVRARVVRKLSALPLGWFTERSSGTVKHAVQDDAVNLHYLVTHAMLDVVGALVTPIAVLVYLFTVSPGLAAILLLPILTYLVLTARMFYASTSQLAQFTVWEKRVSSEAVAYLDGLAVARVYDAGPAAGLRGTLTERAQFLDSWQRPLTARKVVVDLVTRPLTMLLLIIVAGGPLVAAGAVSPADFLPFLLLGVTFGGQLVAAAFGFASVREATAAAQRIGVLLSEPELPETPQPQALTGERHTVRFDNVGFSYDGQHTVLSGIDLELRPGTMTALVGPSGAGKSTLASLLARFHDPTTGRITIDGVDLRELTLADLYTKVGFVFQDPRLIRGTVHDNIALARPQATREQVEQAARAAQIHDRITFLPEGYDTVDTRLSGGEAQRLTIARALLADPSVLILDEATAFADPESEYQVQQALSALVAGRTVVVIAHRLHTVTGADTIVVLDGGRIAQRGTHAALLATPGLYRELWQASQPLERNHPIPHEVTA